MANEKRLSKQQKDALRYARITPGAWRNFDLSVSRIIVSLKKRGLVEINTYGSFQFRAI